MCTDWDLLYLGCGHKDSHRFLQCSDTSSISHKLRLTELHTAGFCPGCTANPAITGKAPLVVHNHATAFALAFHHMVAIKNPLDPSQEFITLGEQCHPKDLIFLQRISQILHFDILWRQRADNTINRSTPEQRQNVLDFTQQVFLATTTLLTREELNALPRQEPLSTALDFLVLSVSRANRQLRPTPINPLTSLPSV